MESPLNTKDIIKEVESLRLSSLLRGIPCGFKELDKVTNGFQGGNLYTFAGRPSMGNSSFTINIARNAAVDHNINVAYFTLEQTKDQIQKRLIAAESEIELEKLYNGKLADYEWAQLDYKVQKLDSANLYIKDYSSLYINEFIKASRELVSKGGVRLIILDDIQRLSISEDQRKFAANREQEVSNNVRELKSLAKELNIPIIINSQLNRSVETRGGDKKPILSDLRDSGAIENDSDVVMFLYRPEYYGITEDEMGNPTQGVCEIIVAKHRNGYLANIPLQFIPKFTKFRDLEYQSLFGDPFGNSGLPPSNLDDPFCLNNFNIKTKRKNSKNSSSHTNFVSEEPPF
jgi:replicative DNA helicase